MKLLRIHVNQRIHDALAVIARAEQVYRPGFDSGSIMELPKLALADAILDAVHAQHAARLARLPKRAVAAVVDCELRPKRRRQRA